MSFWAHLSQQVTYSSLATRTCGRLASTAKTTPLTGHCVSLPAIAPGWTFTSLELYLSLVAHAKRHALDIRGSKLPAIFPRGFSHATAVAPLAGLHELAALAFSDGPHGLLHWSPANTAYAPVAITAKTTIPMIDRFILRPPVPRLPKQGLIAQAADAKAA